MPAIGANLIIGGWAMRSGGGGVSPLSNMFVGGEDGYLFSDFTETDEQYTEGSTSGAIAGGRTKVVADNDPVGFILSDHGWGGLSLTAMLAAATELIPNGTFPNTTGWAPVNCSLSVVAGRLRLLSTINGTGARVADTVAIPVEVGELYWFGADLVGPLVGPGAMNPMPSIKIRNNANTVDITTFLSQDIVNGGLLQGFWKATETPIRLRLRWDGDASTTTASALDFDNISMKKLPIPGNKTPRNFIQMVAARRPLWRANAGKPYLQFDGTDDRIGSVSPFALQATNVGCVAVAFRATNIAADRQIFASGSSTGNKRLRLNSLSSGNLGWVFGTGDIHVETIAGSSLNRDFVMLMNWGAGSVQGYLDGVKLFDTVRASAHDGTGDGTFFGSSETGFANFFFGRIYGGFMINRQVTEAEINHITKRMQALF